jgi:SAM-dependent methyltransferase
MPQTREAAGLRALVGLSGATDADRVLDVACGPGFLTVEFARRCRYALGVDATEELLVRARREAAARGIENVEFVLGEADALGPSDASFDVASCRAAFHHFEDPRKALLEMKRVVRPGGRLLIADMLSSEDPAQAEYHDRIERLCDRTHVRALRESELEALCRDAGLEILLRPKSVLHYDVEEWLEHGGPDEETRQEIRRLLRASLDVDRSGLQVRLEHERLRFSHTTTAFVLRVPP